MARYEAKDQVGKGFGYYTYGDVASNTVWGFYAHLYTNTLEEAQAIAAKFPKYIKLSTNLCTCLGYDQKTYWLGSISLRVHLSSDGVNKGVNETGIKRVRKFFEFANKLGIATYENPCIGNMLSTSLITEVK